MTKESSKRFGVLLCAEDSEYVKKKHGGYFGLFKAMLGEAGETWDVFRAFAGELPGDDAIGLYDGFVITGSCSDANGDDDWIVELVALLRKLDAGKKKVLGICFGHQVLGRALGGTVGRAKSWDIGLRTIHVSDASFSSLAMGPTQLSVIECHQDEVKDLPPSVEVVARSDKTVIEIFRFKDHMMGIQGHPEYTQDILLHLVDRLLMKSLIKEPFGEELKVKISSGACEPNKEAWRRLCINFLKRSRIQD